MQGSVVNGPVFAHSDASLGRLEVYTYFFFLQWLLFFTSIGVEVNGQRQKRPWGLTTFDLPPGSYHLKIYFNYLFGPAGIAEHQVNVYAGYATRLNYSPPFFVFMSGSIREVPPRPCA
jgi:hypothetical protein